MIVWRSKYSILLMLGLLLTLWYFIGKMYKNTN